MPFFATVMPPILIFSLSRMAFSPALPMAMTTRPQLASSPAIAVFTSGELAIDMAIRCAALSFSAPVMAISMNFSAPSPSFATWCARSMHKAVERLGEALEPRIVGDLQAGERAARRARGKHQHRVGGRGIAIDRDAVEARD